jgi:hypothetical protein
MWTMANEKKGVLRHLRLRVRQIMSRDMGALVIDIKEGIPFAKRRNRTGTSRDTTCAFRAYLSWEAVFRTDSQKRREFA